MSATFDEWIKAMFDHPVREREWYWDDDFDASWDRLGMTDALTVDYMTELFLAPHQLANYSYKQVAQGIWFLVGESSPGKSAYALLNSDVTLGGRIDCVQAVTKFFGQFVAPAAQGAADTKNNSFHSACFMWWDIFPTYGAPNVGESELHSACLDVMSEILSLSSEVCQLSALHGLNHWHLYHANRVEATVDSFLQKTPGLTPRIIEYAATARSGAGQ
jgi:hypothetical protein